MHGLEKSLAEHARAAHKHVAALLAASFHLEARESAQDLVEFLADMSLSSVLQNNMSHSVPCHKNDARSRSARAPQTLRAHQTVSAW